MATEKQLENLGAVHAGIGGMLWDIEPELALRLGECTGILDTEQYRAERAKIAVTFETTINRLLERMRAFASDYQMQRVAA